MREVIAIDLGGTNLRVSLVRGSKIVQYIKKSTPKTKRELLREMCKGIEELINKDVKGIGVASAGPLKEGIIKNPPNLPLRNFNLKRFLEKKFRKKVVLENDAKCVALAESVLGCKKKNFIILTLGTGVGGGVIVDGKLYVGEGYGGELGHIILDNKQDFESLWKLYRAESKRYFGKELTIKQLLYKKSRKGDEIVDRTVSYLSQGIGSLINVFDPEIVVLAGGVRETGSVIMDRIKKEVLKYSILPKKTPIAWSKLDHPGTLGASLLIR